MKKQTERLTLKKEILKDLSRIRTGIKAGLASQQCHPQSGLSLCIECPQ
jgi:hypothetical protein